ncbi:MAG: hypothetical protein AABM29_02385 [Actinomycetota bacterium]
MAPGIALFLALGAIGCGGGDGDGGEGTAPAEATGGDLSIDPESGPPGTAISWNISTCEAGDDKGVAIYASPLEEYRSGAQAKQVIEGPEGKQPSGTITVPKGVSPGEYTISGSCLSREELGQGQVQLGVKEETAAFTVTE